MATLVATCAALPSFARPLELKDLQISHNTRNIETLAALFVRHNAHKYLGVHLIHGHFKIPTSMVMLGSNFENPGGRWTKPTDIHTIDLNTVHGHSFVLKNNEFLAYEYQDRPIPDFSGIGKEFIPEFVDYITKNGLTKVLGLQVDVH